MNTFSTIHSRDVIVSDLISQTPIVFGGSNIEFGVLPPLVILATQIPVRLSEAALHFLIKVVVPKNPLVVAFVDPILGQKSRQTLDLRFLDGLSALLLPVLRYPGLLRLECCEQGRADRSENQENTRHDAGQFQLGNPLNDAMQASGRFGDAWMQNLAQTAVFT